MKRVIPLTAVIFMLASASALAEREVEDYSDTIDMFKQNPTVAPFFDSAYGYAVFPTIGKGGLGFGAAHGAGQVYRDGEVTGLTAMTNISFGLQAGGQAYMQVIFFENQAAYDNFTSGNFEFSAQAAAIAIQASGQAGTSTEGTGVSGGTGAAQQKSVDYQNSLLVFTMAKGGLMYEATIAGQKYSFDPVEPG